METESSGVRSSKSRSWSFSKETLLLAYQSFGIVYGDLCTSPVYVYKSTFSGRLRLHEEDAEILGVLSLVIWTLTLLPLLKYIVFVLTADDNGEGGTFALYSLMCRNSKMGLLRNYEMPYNHQATLEYKPGVHCKESNAGLKIRSFVERNLQSRIVLFIFALLGVSMVIGDGVFTPTMSVLSAVSGLQIKFPGLHQNSIVVIACVILVALFALQHYGTRRVGFFFAPVQIAWLACITSIGVYNIVKWNPSVIQAFSPYYIYNFFKQAGKDGWSSLGGIVLCVTGAEAMFADLGHFSKLSIRVGFTAVVYPCLVVAYMGEAAYLSKHHEDLERSFYMAVPEVVFWPVLIIATLATAVGSQAIISATFSNISQCRALGCFPRVKIIHTSNSIYGQIYIPEVNWLLMLLCLAITLGFRDTHMIGNAYGLAVIIVMLVTTCLMFFIITTVWNRPILWALLFVFTFGSLELLYLSACLAKVHHGGWVPLLLSSLCLLSMSSWHYGTFKKQHFEVQNKISLDRLLDLGPTLGLVRVPGIGLVFSNLNNGVSPMFAHFVTNFPAFHRILIFVSLETQIVPKVPLSERFVVGRLGSPEHHIFRCVVRYGYKDAKRDSHNFETQLLMKVAEFIRQEGDANMARNVNSIVVATISDQVASALEGSKKERKKRVAFKGVFEREKMKAEVQELVEEKENGVSYVIGHTIVLAHDSSSVLKRTAINIYGFLRRNSRRPSVSLGLPHTSVVEVGMVYRV
ncbi:Potassium transporter [Rhynchospora pubera]|uniref:Potassium transporter n=1 Tax=Rhynchospora pubera TaxID=906938 RepID=A0AAV8CPT6_9POAL|nr:Potassium transporter [Rhynchospora pubera]